MSNLRARIERVLSDADPARSFVPPDDDDEVVYREIATDILAALDGVDSEEVAEILTPGIESGDIDLAVSDVCSYFYLIRRGNNDDD